jgi:hypothetical protein
MNIELLNSSHVEDAAKLVFDNYLEERKSVNILPLHDNYLDLFSKSINESIHTGIGVAAIQNGQLAGFLSGMGIISLRV